MVKPDTVQLTASLHSSAVGVSVGVTVNVVGGRVSVDGGEMVDAGTVMPEKCVASQARRWLAIELAMET